MARNRYLAMVFDLEWALVGRGFHIVIARPAVLLHVAVSYGVYCLFVSQRVSLVAGMASSCFILDS